MQSPWGVLICVRYFLTLITLTLRETILPLNYRNLTILPTNKKILPYNHRKNAPIGKLPNYSRILLSLQAAQATSNPRLTTPNGANSILLSHKCSVFVTK